MKENFLSGFPPPDMLQARMKEKVLPSYREANAHIHTPYSFSAFEELETIFDMGRSEGIRVLGINDFYVTDGYQAFHDGCIRNDIFPLFNIEFIGLMKSEQGRGIRINDPNNPGRVYFVGKGLDYPSHFAVSDLQGLEIVRQETQNQLKAMIAKLNALIRDINSQIRLDFDEIREKYAHELVRERHIAKALRIIAGEHYRDTGKRIEFLEFLYGGRKSKADPADTAAMENEIRSNILKAGGSAFVEEDEHSFLDILKLVEIVINAGGIPCYPVLLDDATGNYTEFERNFKKLDARLKELDIACVELIPGRNDITNLEKFVNYFDSEKYIVTYGTEHNTPEMIPLAITARNNMPPDSHLKTINWRGVCVIAAHQYYRAQGLPGYINPDGKPHKQKKKDFETIGQMVIEYFLKDKFNET